MTLKEKSASFISYLLSPISLALYALIIITVYRIQMENGLYLAFLFGLAIIFLCITPVIGILIYCKKGVVDIWVSDQKTRTPFYIVAIIGYILASVLFYVFSQHEFLLLTLAYLAVTTTITLVNLKTKVSSHTGGLMGPLAALLFLFGPIALLCFVLLPVVMWARLVLKAHSVHQLIGGALIGFIVTYATYAFFY